jgi:hypothetical protein
MNQKTFHLLACVAVLTTGSSAFVQADDCNCQNNVGGYVGYQSSDWNGGQGNCECGRSRHHGISAGNGWTRPLCPHHGSGHFGGGVGYPDAGWAPPAHFPVNYDKTWYASYHPQAFYGNPGGGFIANYPVVYQPTDTTQLGYYYHNVPTWQSRPGMIPPTPIPSNFHARICPPGSSCFGGHGFHGQATGNYQNCPQGYVVSGPQHGYVVSGPQFTTPNGQQIVRKAAPEKQGLLGGFRLTSFLD